MIRMSKQELSRAKSLAIKSAYAVRHILPHIFDDVVSISSTHSPSSAFNKMLIVATRNNYHVEAHPVAKLARWLAVIRRDFGDVEFKKTVDMIRSIMVGQDQQPELPYRVVNADLELEPNISVGIYKYGDYSAYGKRALSKINKTIEKLEGLRLPPELHQLALETFYSLYLYNTELANHVSKDQSLQNLADITKPLREDFELRSHTVYNEMLSIIITAKIMAELIRNSEEYGDKDSTQDSGDKGQKPLRLRDMPNDDVARENAKNLVTECVAKLKKEEVEKDSNIVNAIKSLGAGKTGHILEFGDKIDMYKLLREKPVFTKYVLEAITTLKKGRGTAGGSTKFAGYRNMQSFEELKYIRLTEHAYPDDVKYYRILTKKVNVKKFKEDDRGAKKRRYVVLIDKSYSMAGEKLDWARAVAVSLLVESKTDDVMVGFFDSEPYEIESVTRDIKTALEKILSVRGGGGTSIDLALEKADKTVENATIVLITDGEDTVTYKPMNELISIMIQGDNEYLRQISKKYIRVDELSGKIAKDITG